LSINAVVYLSRQNDFVQKEELLEELHEEGVRKSSNDGGSLKTPIFSDGENPISDVRGTGRNGLLFICPHNSPIKPEIGQLK
jgi:hypothetical protein